MFRILLTICCLIALPVNRALADEASRAPLSLETEKCIGCHISATPGIVKDWMASRHYRITPGEALKKPKLERRISVQRVPERLSRVAVGCFECHSQNPDKHTDNFDHLGYRINVVVSPNDCATCHSVEARPLSLAKPPIAFFRSRPDISRALKVLAAP